MEKYTKAETGYEHPAKGPNHCGQCKHFRAPHGCEIVAGRIEPEDWCEKFSKASRMAKQFGKAKQ